MIVPVWLHRLADVLVKLANRIRAYTDKTCLRRFQKSACADFVCVAAITNIARAAWYFYIFSYKLRALIVSLFVANFSTMININAQTIDLMNLPSVPLEMKLQLPRTSGIYFAIDSSNKVQYIGKANNLRKRWSNTKSGCQSRLIIKITTIWSQGCQRKHI